MAKSLSMLVGVVLVAITLSNYSHAGLIYSQPAFKGKVLDVETKKPIGGAVVVAYYIIETPTPPAGAFSHPIGVRETLTDKAGNYYLPPYTKMIDPLSRSRDTSFIIFKPGYGTGYGIKDNSGTNYIAAIKPSTIDYLENHKDKENEKRIDYAVKKTKTLSEGLIYSLRSCKNKLDSIKNMTPFDIQYFFLPLKNAARKIGRLEVPLDCPSNVEPVPISPGEFDKSDRWRNEVEEVIAKSITIVELPKLKAKEARIKNIPSLPYLMPDMPDLNSILENQKYLIQSINEEEASLGLQKSDPYKSYGIK
ncbi:MAG TPA: hypothetical protein VI298_17245 [Geobacteraceae bacterium]